MKICDAEKETGLDRATIRFYEKEGYISPKRLENGYRDYSEEEIELLLKLKLLRQLGFSLEKINQLQQGSIDFDAALSQQFRTLSEQIHRNQASVQVCKEMSTDCVNYQTLDSRHYLTRHQQIIDSRELPSSNTFREAISEEPPHPWRRFFARMLDYAMLSCIVRFFLFVVFRIRPIPGDFLNTLLSIGIGILLIPIEALLLSVLGATPGKMLMGIQLEEAREGKYLSFDAALHRAANVFTLGVGLYLPFIELIALVYHYCVLTGRSMRRFAKYNEVNEPLPMAWDDGIETTYKDPSGKRTIALLCAVASLITLSAITATDSMKPKHRGSELTLEQFVENYNGYLKYTDNDTIYKLERDGTRIVPLEDPNSVVIYMNGDETNLNKEYSYELENDMLRTVIYENTWEEPFYLIPIGDAAITPAVTLLLSQKGCGVRELKEFTQLWEDEMDKPVGTVSYRNITVSWEIIHEAGIYNKNVVFPAGDEPSPVSVYVSVTVNPVN